MSSNILEKSDRPDVKYFERLKFDQGVGLSCTVLQQRALHLQVFVSFGGDSGDRSAAQSVVQNGSTKGSHASQV